MGSIDVARTTGGGIQEAVLRAGDMHVCLDVHTQVLTVGATGGKPLARLRLLASVDTLRGLDELRVTGTDVDVCDGELRTVRIDADSALWQRHQTVLSASGGVLELTTAVQGAGPISTVRQLGGRVAGLGLLPSGLAHRSVFSPNPDQPWRVMRRAEESAVIGVVGDGGQPGVGRWLFTPSPLCFGITSAEVGSSGTLAESGPAVARSWLMLGVAAARRPFTQMAYEALTPGFSVRYDYEGHTSAAGRFTTPTLLLFLADDPYSGLKQYRELLQERGLIPNRSSAAPSPAWRHPMFCGWGAQNADAQTSSVAPRDPAAFSRQRHYDRYLTALKGHDIVPGTVVVDDKWQAEYATCRPDPDKWPDLAAWIARRHDEGQRVLLWYKAWDTEGATPAACVRDHTDRPIAIDPESADGVRVIEQAAHTMISELGADGIKVDFTASTPSGANLRHAGPSWGIDLLHELLRVLYSSVKALDPDALVVTHTPEAGFRDVTDAVRLNDVLMLDQPGGDTEPCDAEAGSAVVATMTYRAQVARSAWPDVLIDTDGWPLPSRAAYRSWTAAQHILGIPSLYYSDRLDVSDAHERAIQPADLAATARHWAAHRSRLDHLTSAGGPHPTILGRHR
jgi:hypothetical protein